MAIPTQDAILAAMRTTAPDFSKLQMEQTGTMGAKTFADFTPEHAASIPTTVKEGLERLSMYDTEGKFLPSPVQKMFKTDIPKVGASTPASTNESGWTTNLRILGEEVSTYDKGLGAIVAPGPVVAAGLKRLGFSNDLIKSMAEEPIEGMAQKLLAIFEGGIGKNPTLAPAVGPLAFTAGMISDPSNLTGLGEAELGGLARAIQLAQMGEKEGVVAKILSHLLKVGVDEGLAGEYALRFAKADFPTIEKGIENLHTLMSTSKIVGEAAHEATGADGSLIAKTTSGQVTKITNPAGEVTYDAATHVPAALPTKQEAADAFYDTIIKPQIDAKHPIVLSGDDIKIFFGKDFNPVRSDLYSAANYQNVQRVLKEHPGDFILLGGGPGAGKTEFLTKSILKNGFGGIVYDNSLSNYAGVVKLIEQARAEGKGVQIMGIVPNLDTAFAFTRSRAAVTGREVAVDAFARGHAGFGATVEKLLREGVITPEEIALFDTRFANSGEIQKMINMGISAKNPLDLIKKAQYSEKDIIRKYGNHPQTIERANGVPGNARGSRGSPAGGGAGKGRAELPVVNVDKGAKAAVDQGAKETAVKDPALIRAISEEKQAGPVRDLLEPHFPKVTEKTLNAFSKRLAQLTRASDIEGTLSALQRLENQANETGQRILDNVLPVSARSALSKRQAQLTVDQLSRQIKTPENAALAEAEYNHLWEFADQKIIDRFNEANVERAILEDVLDDHRGKALNGLYKGTFLSPHDVSLGELMEQRKGKAFDSRIDEIMGTIGGDVSDAQRELESYFDIRQQIADVKKEISELRPNVRSAQVVRGMLDDMPVVPDKNVALIDDLANTADLRGTYHDISGVHGGFRDMYRNFEHFFGTRFPQAKEGILDPFDDAKGANVEEIKKFGDDIEKNIIQKYGFKRGSEESAAIQDWGERNLMSDPKTANPQSKYHTTEALIAKFGEKKAMEIQAAADWFHSEYNKVITRINDVRRKIYPNNPSKLVPFRKDYFRHYEEFGSGVMDAVKNFMDVPSGIDPKLVGVSEFTKPKSKWQSLMQARKGPISRRDAIGGFLDYAPAASYSIHIDPHIGVFRYLRRKLAEKAPIQGGKEDNVMMEGIDNFLQHLDDFANNLATKTNPVDRWMQKRIPGGRATMRAIDWISNRVKANTILGNAGSTVAQTANIPAGVASAKLYSIPGMNRTVASIFTKNTAAGKSIFLKERYLVPLTDRFTREFKSAPIKAGTEAAARVAAELLKIGDMVGTHFIWNSHYEKYLGQNTRIVDGMRIYNSGASEEAAIRYADGITRKLVAGRGIGELPVDQQAKITQTLAPFTVEVQNLWWNIGDHIKARDFTGIATLLVADYLFNEASQRIRGSRIVYDPINALLEGAATLEREAAKGNYIRGGVELVGRQIGEALSNVPFGQDATAMLPDAIFGMKKTDLFGQGDPNRFGPPVLLAGALKNPAWRIAPPFGGLQMKKTYEGIRALMDKQATSATGKSRYPIAWTPANFVRATLFGPASVNQGQNTSDELHQRIASQTADRSGASQEAVDAWQNLKQIRADKGAEAAAAEWARLAKEQPALLTKIKALSDDEAKGMTANDRLILQLGVENGERARYVVDQISSLKTKEEQQALWKEYVTKKILTKDVAAQVTTLLAN